jgi:hypothetical protein
VKDNVAAVTVADYGVKIYDVFNPTNPRLIWEHSVSGYVRSVYFDNDLFFVASDFNGLRILNGQDPTNVSEVGYYKTNGLSKGTYYRDGYIYVIDIDCGFWILEHDCDEDDLLSRTEFELGTPPDNPDADSDNLTDGSEVNIYFTNPLNNDSDSDAMPDGWEVQYGLNPLIDDSQQDSDNDHLSALNEFLAGTSPLTNDTDLDLLSDSDELLVYGTSPIKSDTDSDLMPDGWEVEYGLNPLFDDAHEDADGDTLDNLLEYEIGTNPLLTDTDQDNYSDGWEYNNGFDPLDPTVSVYQYLITHPEWIIIALSGGLGIVFVFYLILKLRVPSEPALSHYGQV